MALTRSVLLSGSSNCYSSAREPDKIDVSREKTELGAEMEAEGLGRGRMRSSSSSRTRGRSSQGDVDRNVQ
eukprot:9129424-Pyramimonas_sp.AAC.1